jgi:hypothetical protein
MKVTADGKKRVVLASAQPGDSFEVQMPANGTFILIRVRSARSRRPRTEPPDRLTRLAPWPRGALAKAYKRAGRSGDAVETAAVVAQGKPAWED